MVIDAHQHFWNLQRVDYPWLGPSSGSIYRTIEAGELEPQLKAAGVDKTVLVQSANSYEDTEYMLTVAAEYSWVGAVVGWVPLLDPDEEVKMLEVFTQNRLFKGVRHLIHDESDPDWVIQDRVIEGLKVLASFGMTFDIVAVFPNHLKHVPLLAERVPNLRFVIDHLAKPPIKDHQMEPWVTQLAAAASYPNVYAKISGLNTAANWEKWSADDLRPYVDKAFELFSAQRLMFGSDWPVATLAGDYKKVWGETNRALVGYSQMEIDAVFGNTAAKFYNIG